MTLCTRWNGAFGMVNMAQLIALVFSVPAILQTSLELCINLTFGNQYADLVSWEDSEYIATIINYNINTSKYNKDCRKSVNKNIYYSYKTASTS